jgi:hypothetical protein
MRGRLARRTDQNSPTPLCATAVKQRGDGHEARDDLRSVDEQHPHFRDSSAPHCLPFTCHSRSRSRAIVA